MHTTNTDTRHVWCVGSVLAFTLTLVMVVHASTATLYADTRDANTTHPLIDVTDLPAFLLHGLAYYIACISTTVFLLLCAAIILGLATMLMELLAESLLWVHSFNGWRSTPISPQGREIPGEHLDTYCDSWNYQ